MHLLVSDRRQRGHDHVEAVEPRPAFNEMKSRRADRNNANQRDTDKPKIANDLHSSRWSLVVGRWQIQKGQRPTTDYKTKGPPRMCGRPKESVTRLVGHHLR